MSAVSRCWCANQVNENHIKKNQWNKNLLAPLLIQKLSYAYTDNVLLANAHIKVMKVGFNIYNQYMCTYVLLWYHKIIAHFLYGRLGFLFHCSSVYFTSDSKQKQSSFSLYLDTCCASYVLISKTIQLIRVEI